MRFALTLAVSSLLLAACRTVGPPATERDVRQAIDSLIAADNRRDLEFVVQSYTEDIELVPPSGEPVRGIKALRARYAALFADWRPELRIEHAETHVDGATARDRGRTHGTLYATAGSATKPVDDDYEAELRLEGERWRVARLSWRPAQPVSGS